jgi:spore maturation protein CgeE
MKKEIIDCELSYAKCFCDCVAEPDILRFSDRAVPEMYDHNFTYIENRISDR